jgi:predicted GNAT family N-acyltransferase
VFIEEQGVPEAEEWDAFDVTAHHVVAVDNEQVVGTGRLVELEDGVGRIGRMAVKSERRRKGVGRAILAQLEAEATARGLARIVLHAQVQALAFYESAGYVAEGPVFEEAGILHREMWKWTSTPPDAATAHR